MMLTDIVRILQCDVFSGNDDLQVYIDRGCASDLMSDVLAFSQSGALLLTGLVNIQTIQTAYIAEIRAIVIVRGKKPDNEMLAIAKEKKIPLLGTPYSMYEACGILYNNGLIPTMGCITGETMHG
jgi:predicted transcriptional regulator